MSKDPKSKVVGRILPKARPLIPDEDAQDQAILEAYNPDSVRQLIDENDPEITDIDAQIAALQEKRTNVVQLRMKRSLADLGVEMDPDKVVEYCEVEPWKAGALTQLSKSLFGFVPEKFEAAAEMHEEGSPEHKRFMTARDEARLIYDEQLKRDSWRVFSSKKNKSSSRRDHRAELETTASLMHSFYKRELERQEAYKYQAARFLKATMLLGDYFMNASYGRRTSDEGQKMRLSLQGDHVTIEEVDREAGYLKAVQEPDALPPPSDDAPEGP